MDYETFLSYLQRAFEYDLRPSGTGTPGQTYEAGPTFFEQFDNVFSRFNQVDSEIATIQITAGEIDYDQLAASLKEQGITAVIVQPNDDNDNQQ